MTVKHLTTGRWTILNSLFDVRCVIDKLEFQKRRLADNFLGALRILNAGKLDENVALALPLDNRLTDTELIDSVANRLERLVDSVIAQRPHFFFA